ncbi:uncharacterized [Tachysurus ichikawai]
MPPTSAQLSQQTQADLRLGRSRDALLRDKASLHSRNPMIIRRPSQLRSEEESQLDGSSHQREKNHVACNELRFC